MAEKEYIEREAALAFQNELEPLLCRNFVTHDTMIATKDADMLKYLQSIPAADVRPVVKGKWTMHSDFPNRLICSKCGTQFDVWHWEAKQMHFCPNCGANMREES